MRVSIVTFADLGRKTNLKTVNILPVIDLLSKRGALGTIACRIDTGFAVPNTRGAVPVPFHYLIKIIERVFPRFDARRIEERMLDRAACTIEDCDIVIFHPEFCFPKAIAAMRKKGIATLGIATMAHLAVNAKLEEEEQRLMGVPDTDTYYRDLVHNYGATPALDYIVAISDFVKRTYAENGFPADHIFTASTDVAIVPEEKKEGDPARFQALSIAHANLLKGVHYLLDAWAKCDIPGKRLVIAGDMVRVREPLRSKYLKAIAADPTIEFVGPRSRGDLFALFRASDAFVIPSLTEGGPRVALEALSFGLPVVTTENAKTLVEDGVNGFVVPIRDAAAIREALVRMNADRALLRRMSLAATETMRSKPSLAEAVFSACETVAAKEAAGR